MIAYRLAEVRHARTAQDALSGEGAFLFGGRWNPRGYRVAYAAEHLSLAVLEILVHTQDRKKLEDYRLITLEIPDTFTSTLDEGTLPGGWQEALEVTRERGRAWVEAGRSVALLAPSVIIPGEHNVLINPLHPDFARLEPTEPVPFRFDPRLIREARAQGLGMWEGNTCVDLNTATLEGSQQIIHITNSKRGYLPPASCFSREMTLVLTESVASIFALPERPRQTGFQASSRGRQSR